MKYITKRNKKDDSNSINVHEINNFLFKDSDAKVKSDCKKLKER